LLTLTSYHLTQSMKQSTNLTTNLTENEKELLRQLEKYKSDNPYLFYIPNKKAERFIQQVGNLEEGRRIHLFIGGNGSSKSCSMANILANICFAEKNPYFKFGIYQNWPFLKKIRLVSDPTTIAEKTVPEMIKWFPRGRYKAAKEKKNFLSHFITDTGFDIGLMTFDQDPKEFESVDLGAIFLDEIPPEDIFNACLSRLRVGEGGIQVAGFTPLAGAGYLFDRYIDNPTQNLASWTYVTTWDNVEGPETRGFLKRETVERMISQFPEEEREARVEGKFMHLGGTIFKEFDRSKHVLHYSVTELVKDIPRHHWQVRYAIDPHPVVNTAVVFMGILPDGRKVIIDEIWSGSDTGVISKMINEKLDFFERIGGDTGKRVGIIDPSAVIKDKMRGNSSWIEDFQKNGVKCTPATKDRDRADDLFRQELRGTVNPNLYFLECCPRSTWETSRYQKDPNNPAKRLDKDDHCVECIGRLIIANPHRMFKTTMEEKRKRIIQGVG